MANNKNQEKSVASKRNLFGSSSSNPNRAHWPPTNTTLFLQLLVDEKNVGNWAGKSASKKGYENISNYILQQTGFEYTKKMLKSKFDVLRTLFHLWTNMFNGQTGAGYEYATGNITMPEEWWEHKIKTNDAFKKFKDGGLENAALMYNVFGDSSATGMYEYTPSAVNPNPGYNFSQVDESVDLDTSPTPHQPAYQQEEVNSPMQSREGSERSRLSGGKRKFGVDDSWNASVESLTNAVEASNSRREYVITKVDPKAEATQKAIDILYAMPNLSQESELFLLALQFMTDKQKRNVFLGIRDDATRLRWLEMNERLYYSSGH